VLAKEAGVDCVLPRDIDDTPLDDPNSGERPGYLMPEPNNDAEFGFKGELDDFPEDWLDVDRGGSPRLRRDQKWVALPSPDADALCLRPLSGAEADVQLIHPALERAVRYALGQTSAGR
jgi:hypothetical protein